MQTHGLWNCTNGAWGTAHLSLALASKALNISKSRSKARVVRSVGYIARQTGKWLWPARGHSGDDVLYANPAPFQNQPQQHKNASLNTQAVKSQLWHVLSVSSTPRTAIPAHPPGPFRTVPLVPSFSPTSASASAGGQSKTRRGTSCLKAAHLPSITKSSRVIGIGSVVPPNPFCCCLLFMAPAYIF